MAQFVGLNQFGEHSLAGTIFAAFDKLEGGGMDYDGGEWKENIGVGGQVVGYRDMLTPTGNASTMLQTGTLIPCLKPATLGALPTVITKIQGGTVVATGGARLQTNCYIKTWKFASSKGGMLMADYAWGALSETDATTIAAAAAQQTGLGFPWHKQTPLFATNSALACQSWEVSGETGISFETSQDAKVSGVERFPETVDPGLFAVKFTATVRVDPGLTLTADTVATLGFKVTAVNGTKTFTIDMTGGNKIQVNKDPIVWAKGKDAVIYQIDGQIKTNDLAACVITFV